jgi:hypothetical protein
MGATSPEAREIRHSRHAKADEDKNRRQKLAESGMAAFGEYRTEANMSLVHFAACPRAIPLTRVDFNAPLMSAAS